MERIYNWFRYTFLTLFGLALLVVLVEDLRRHIANPPTLQHVAIAALIGLGMGAWYWHTAKTTPYVRDGVAGTRIYEWMDGRIICEYPDGVRLHLYQGRLVCWEYPPELAPAVLDR